MIHINLLPEELRRSTRTSPKTLGLLFAASVLCFGGLGTTGFLWFNVRADKQARVDITQEQLEGMMPRAKYADQLDKEKSEFEKRNKTINEIALSRIIWTRKLDRLSEIVSRDATTNRHRAWLDTLDIDCKADTNLPGIKLKGFNAGDDYESVSNFHEDLMTDPVFADGFVKFTPPDMKVNEPDEGVEPAKKTEYRFEIKLPEKDKRKAAPKKPAAPPAASK